MGASVISVILPIKRSPSVPGGRSSEITMSGICDLSKSTVSASLAADITL